MKKIILSLSLLILYVMAVPLIIHAEEPASYSEIGTYIQEEFDKTHIPGMSVEIVDANNILFADTYGNCNSLDSSFIVGSISKSFTAAAVMQLVEKGKVDLSKPMAEYIPSVNKGCKTTVKQLLNQTSGIQTYHTLENYKSSDISADWQYANVNYDLLGQIVENTSGLDYFTYIQKNIFEPLDMGHSFTSIKQAQKNGLIDGYRNHFGFMVKEEMEYPKDTLSGWMTVPAAYIISSTNDMGKYLQFYLNNGENILTSDSINTMLYDSVDVQEGYKYGMGWGLDNRADELILTHGGVVENYLTNMFILPKRGIAAIVMFNAGDYFVSNNMVQQLSYNIIYKLLGQETTDIKGSAYVNSHILIDLILVIILLLSALPLVRIKQWHEKHNGKMNKASVIHTAVIHIAFPTLILNAFAFLGIPMFVIRGFAPDVYIIQFASAAILYIVGIFKIVYYIYGKLRNKRHC